MALKRGTEIPTIDVVLVTLSTQGVSPTEIALDTANKIAVEVQSEVTEAIKNIVKGVLIAQKGAQTTITGHIITLTDNVFNYELAKMLQGGTITYDTETPTKAVGYTPPVSGSKEQGDICTLNAYSAIYDTAGIITGYEKISYPNCKGNPFGLNSEDGVFRVSEYTINSAPAKGQAPYSISIVDELPTIS